MKIVLVHGGWQGGWAWDDVAAALEEKGHETFHPTMLGHEKDDNRAGVTLSKMADDLIARIKDQDWTEFAIVGHSGGGPLAQLVADAMPDAVKNITFVDAWVLHDGECINDVLPAELVGGLTAMASASPDNTVPMTRELLDNAFMQDADAESLDRFAQRLISSPMGWLDQPIRLNSFWAKKHPSAYVFLKEDMAMPSEVYRNMASRLENPKTAESPGSHQAMMTRPRELADAIDSVL